MGKQTDKPFRQMNKWANTSKWIGVCSLLPYLVFGVVYYLSVETMIFIFAQIIFPLAFICLFWGLVFGLAGIVTGILATLQIYVSQRTQTGTLSSVLGIVLGVAAIIVNLIFYFLVFLALAVGSS